MKKVFAFCLTIVFFLSVFAGFTACDKDDSDNNGSTDTWHKTRVADSSLYSDNGYVDYATEVYIDEEKYAYTSEMGLFWTYWDESQHKIVEVAADSAEGAALVDPSKPTIINIHGMLSDGYFSQEHYLACTDYIPESEYEIADENGTIYMTYLWLRKGYNVANYHYNRFASEASDPPLIECKIWANNGKSNVRYRLPDNTVVDNPTEYCVAELFAGEYLRAINLLPDSFGTAEIRVAAHSMGGEVAAGGLFLLTELADVGQLDPDCLPDRYTLLDTYFSTNLRNKYLGPTGLTIRWSNKAVENDNLAYTIVDCLKDIEANGCSLEYYTNAASFLQGGIKTDVREEFESIVTYVLLNSTLSHNDIRSWYLCSICFDPPIIEENEVGASAATSTERIKALKGKKLKINLGNNTPTPLDDTFIYVE